MERRLRLAIVMSFYLALGGRGFIASEVVTTSPFSRRRALQLIGLAGGAAVLGPVLAACGSSDGARALAGNKRLRPSVDGESPLSRLP